MKAIVSRYLTGDNATKKLEFPRDIYPHNPQHLDTSQRMQQRN
jgi:hypothetical protein